MRNIVLLWFTLVCGVFAQSTLTYLDVGGAYGMAIDPQGNRYIAASFTTGPVVNGVPARVNAGVVKLDSSNNVVFRYVFPGKGYQYPRAIAVDSHGNIFIAGYELSEDFPVIDAIAVQNPQVSSGFLSKLDPSGSRLLFSYVFAGQSAVNAIALDSTDHVYITGYTRSLIFPITPNAFQKVGPRGYSSAFSFAMKVSNDGNAILFSTYLGADYCAPSALVCKSGEALNFGNSIAVAADGSVVVAGSTTSASYPVTPGAFQTSTLTPGVSTGFVTSLKPDGSGLNWSTFFGGSRPGDSVSRVALARDGSPVIAGLVISLISRRCNPLA